MTTNAAHPLLAALMFTLALTAAARADWLYDAAGNSITNQHWKIYVTAAGTNLTIVGVSPPRPLTPTALPLADPIIDSDGTAYALVAIGGSILSVFGGTDPAYSSSVQSVTLPDTLLSIGNRAFGYCYALTSAIIPASVTNIGRGAFADSTSLTEIMVAPGNPAYKDIGGVLFDTGAIALIQCPGGKTGHYTIPAGVTDINTSAFSRCANLTGVSFPDSVASIGYAALQ